MPGNCEVCKWDGGCRWKEMVVVRSLIYSILYLFFMSLNSCDPSVSMEVRPLV